MLLSGVSYTAYIREFISLFASIIQVTVPLCYLKDPLRIPLTVPDDIVCDTVSP